MISNLHCVAISAALLLIAPISHSQEAAPGAMNSADTASLGGLFRLSDPLDEPEYYCLDIPGFRDSVQLDGELMAHTCKVRHADDERFVLNYPRVGQIYASAYDLCVTAKDARESSALTLAACSDSPSQLFEYTEQKQLTVRNTAASRPLCISVAAEDGTPTGGPSHLRRDLNLAICATADRSLTSWDQPPAKE